MRVIKKSLEIRKLKPVEEVVRLHQYKLPDTLQRNSARGFFVPEESEYWRNSREILPPETQD